MGRLQILWWLAVDTDLRRLPALRAQITGEVRRIEASRDDVGLAYMYLWLAGVDIQDTQPGALTSAEDRLTRAQLAIVRAGSPVRATYEVAAQREELELRLGHFDAAARAGREALRIASANEFDPWRAEWNLVVTLGIAGRLDEAAAEVRVWRDRAARTFGDDDPILSSPHLASACVLEVAGDLRGALAEVRRGEQLFLSMHDVPDLRKRWGRIYELELQLRLKDAVADAPALIASLGSLGTTPPLQEPDGIATARRAGLFAVFEYAVVHELGEPIARLDHAATYAFYRHDLPTWTKLAADVERRCRDGACAKTMRFARWLAVLAAPNDVENKLAALEHEYGDSAAAVAYSGIVLAKLDRWNAARTKLEAARAAPNVWELQADLVELDTWLGLARLRVRGDARPLFEEAVLALSIRQNGIDGFSYMTPHAELALAQMVWDDGDHERARFLGTRARDHFAELGPWTPNEATPWLASH